MKKQTTEWQKLVSFNNLYTAWRKARKGKARRTDVMLFELDLEPNLLQLQQALKTGDYRPGDYRTFTIYERKAREISAAPFRDRVVHHALMNIVEPLMDRRFIYDSWACRREKGVHRAVARYQKWSNRYAYALKMDVRWYFPSIDRRLLKVKLRNYLTDPQILQLFDLIIDSSPPFTRQAPHHPRR